MGKRGAVFQPTEIIKAKGYYRPSRHGELKDKVVMEHLSEVPKTPEILNEHGSKFWYDMLNQLLKAKGLVMIADLPTFQMMAFKFQVYIECAELLKVQGKWIKDDKGDTKENPILKTMEKTEKIFIALSREFGCTPNARNRLNFEIKETKPDSFAVFQL